MSDQRTTYNECVGYDDHGNAIILNSTFVHSDGFHCATGTIIELVSQERYNFETKFENLVEYAEELWRNDAGQTNGTTDGLTEWVEDHQDELIESRYDTNDSEYVPEGDYYITNCIGAGRIFPQAIENLSVILRPDLLDVIREAENGN